MASRDYLQDLGETTLEGLGRLHATYDSTGIIRDAMRAMFGDPVRCLVCACPLHWDREPPNDIDPWFCMGHCPVCLNDEELAA
jgi:hypothetical protein